MRDQQQSIHALRLSPGQDLKRSLQQYLVNHDMEAAWLITCVGSLTRGRLRMANQAEATEFDGHYEIVSLVGTLSKWGSHLHMSVSDEQGRLSGGHLLEGSIVYTTAEVVLGEARQLRFSREEDPETGYRELRISRK